ncbi:MAG: M50 family metallopeptidase, partial [Acidimicrobiaceae bacterium]|nr:M50 family metallopeptidase [Acidimicrobiaceae bacterium]
MRDTVRLGRLGGIPIGVNWTLIAFAGLLAVGLAGSRLPHDAPGYSDTAYNLVGAGTAVALLIGVLLHEVGHAIVARRAGHRVDGITLSWMGGITRIEGDARRPGVELGIAAIGPAVSAVLGGLLFAGREVAIGAGAGQLVVAALGWLAVIQVALALFNLLPAAPLDGGRVL